MKTNQGRNTSQRFRVAQGAVSALAVIAAFAPVSAMTQETGAGDARELPRVDVIGSTRELSASQGSAAVIDGQTLEQSRVFNVNEALRKVPGVHVREEEGVGLRPNIGIRGLNPTRSTKTLLLEDGLPLSFAPYGDNASYYHPPIDRYESIEISKGSQVIRFGPQTAGGVINYITPEPQKEFGGVVGLAAGTRGYLNGHLMLTGNGAIADIYHKESDGARDNMHSRLDDLNFKWAGQLNDDNKLVLRATHFREHSQLTYSGMSQTEYEKLGARYNPFKNDFFDANRTGLSATHELRLNADAKLITSIYGAYFDRDWWRQASSSTDCNVGGARTNGTSLSGTTLDGNTGADCRYNGRLRTYTTAGIDSRIMQRHQTFGIQGELEAGIKLHHEVQDRRQLVYQSYADYLRNDVSTLTNGTAHVQENQQRKTRAMSGFVANRFELNERLAVTPILRIENIDNTRTNYVNATQGSVRFTEFVPGIGASYRLSPNATLYGGVHKGYSPPRVEDAISSGGAPEERNAERSINAELGLRSNVSDGIFVDAAVFRNDFSNLVQVGSIAGGTTAYQEGKALFQGLEVAGQFERLTRSVDGNLFARVAWTWLPVAEQKSVFSSGTNGNVVGGIGNRLPYAPENLLNLTLGYQAPANWNTRVEYVYVGEQFSDFANIVDVNSSNLSASQKASGQFGRIASYGIWNAVLNYTVGNATFFIAGKNLSDATYIVDRTRGIQVGMPRTVQAGMKYAF